MDEHPAHAFARLADVPEVGLLENASETVFDNLVAVAAQLCDAPLALIALAQGNRRWVKARRKYDEAALRRVESFCAPTLAATVPTIVTDATADPELARHPAVLAEPQVRFLASVPLLDPDGQPAGALCVIDRVARELPLPTQRALAQLGEVVQTVLNLQGQLRARMIDDARFRAIFEQEPECVKLVARDGSLLDMNPAGLRMIGAGSIDEVQGRAVTDLIAPGDRAAFQAFHERIFHGEPARLEFTIIGLKGCMRRMESTAGPVRDANGDVIAALGLTRDVTERRLQEENLMRAQRIENLGLLAAGVAHDLNNILTPVMMTAHLLRPRASPDDQRTLALMERSAERGAALVRRILTFAQGVDAERDVINLKPVARDIAGLVQETFPRLIDFQCHIADRLWAVRASSTQVHQVLLNLCVNARDAMPRGGRLTMRISNRELDAAAAAQVPGGRPGCFVVAEVSDTGTGIPPEVEARIWEPFFTTKPAGKGTGLGLSTVRRIIETHGGFCEVANRPGKGVTFRVHLPAEGESPATRPAVAVAELPRGAGELILVVDDEPSVRETAESVLNWQGYRSLPAADGIEAINHLTQHHATIALVLLDRNLPRITGDELALLLRKQYPELPVILMTGDPNSLDPAGPPPGVTILSKPFLPDDLLRAVAEALPHA